MLAKLLNDNPTISHIHRSFNVQLCAFQMHSKEIIDLAKQKSAQGKFTKKIAQKLILFKAAVHCMIKIRNAMKTQAAPFFKN